MKRGTPRHPKVFDLLQALDMPVRGRATVIGHLELLWHFTAEFAPQGDIGKYSDDRIEGAMDWCGKRGKLIAALIKSGWIDSHENRRETDTLSGGAGSETVTRLRGAGLRLTVHGWHEHADDSVRKRLTRGGLCFLSDTHKVTGHRPQPIQTSADIVRLPLPEPMPYASPDINAPDGAYSLSPPLVNGNGNGHPKKPTRARVRSMEQIEKALGERLVWWEEFWKVFPCHEGKNEAMDAFERKILTHDLAVEVYRGAKAYAAKCAADPECTMKYGQGWINRERWKDEIVVRDVVKSKQQRIIDMIDRA